MTKIKRILMALALCSISIGAVACSSNGGGKLSNEEIVNKIEEVSKSVKSSKANVESKVSFNIGGKDFVTSVKMETEAISEPLKVKVVGKTETLGKSFDVNMYITGEDFYLQNIITKEWMHVNDANLKKTLEGRKNSANFDDSVELLNAMQKNLKIEDKGSTYEATYSGMDDSVKDTLKKILSSSQPDAEKVLKNMEIEKLDIKYVIDKNTFYPTECEIKSVMKVSEAGQDVSFNAEIKFKYSDINQVKEIVIPDEVKNAKEYKGN
mgnify:CR=1 FL=1